MPKDKLCKEALTPRRSPRHQKKCKYNGWQPHLMRPASIFMELMAATSNSIWEEDLKPKLEPTAPDTAAIRKVPNASRKEPKAKSRGFWMLSGSVRIRVEVPDEFQDIPDDTETPGSIRNASIQTHPHDPITTLLDVKLKIEPD